MKVDTRQLTVSQYDPCVRSEETENEHCSHCSKNLWITRKTTIQKTKEGREKEKEGEISQEVVFVQN